MLIQECRKHKIIIMVGYVLRFFRPLQVIKQALKEGKIGKILSIQAAVGRYLPDWRPGMDYRKNVSAREDLGGGVVFELSHELDYVRWLVGEIKEVNAATGRVGNFKIDVEDMAEITIIFKNKALGHIHLDMLDRAMNRGCRILGTEGTIAWNWFADQSHLVNWYSAQTKVWTPLLPSTPIDYNEMFIEEIQHFFNCVKEKKQPAVSLADGKRIVALALAIKRSAKDGKKIKV